MCVCVQSDLREKVNILKDDSIDHCQKKNLTNICLILNGYRYRVV